jgi:hypothetical protein
MSGGNGSGLCWRRCQNLQVAAALASSIDRRIMSVKKPIPILSEPHRKICPVCGKQSYSAGGIHPQCAVQQADAPRQLQLKAKKIAEGKKKPAAKKLPQVWSQKKCPKCSVEIHVRRKTCDCGFNFFKP